MNTESDRKLTPYHWIVPALVLGIATVAVWVGGLDLALSRVFYEPGAADSWPVGQGPLWSFLSSWGEVPAVVVGIVACLLIAAGASRLPRPEMNRAGILLLVALILGPLLLTNGVLKSYFGRPRPVQVEAFGGDRPFQPVLVPTFRSGENSFPSGHAAAGFALILPYFALRRRYPRWAVAALGGGLLWGGLMGAGRIVQGGHFLSDVLWSAGVDYFSGYAAARWVEFRQPLRSMFAAKRWNRPRRYLIRGAAVAVAVLIAAAYLFRFPFRLTHEWVVPLKPGVRIASIEFVTQNGKAKVIQVATAGQLRILTTASGRGLPFIPVKEKRRLYKQRRGRAGLRYVFLPRWPTINFSSRMVVQVPKGVRLFFRKPRRGTMPVIVREPPSRTH